MFVVSSRLIFKSLHYHPRMRVGNVFSRVCLCVCLSICLSVHLSVSHRNFNFGIQIYLHHIKVIGSRLRSYEKNDNFTYFKMLIHCMLIKVMNKIKVTHQSQGHIKVKSQGQGQMRKIIILLISRC